MPGGDEDDGSELTHGADGTDTPDPEPSEGDGPATAPPQRQPEKSKHQAKPADDDDPEVEIKGFGKKKRSEWANELARAKGSQSASAKEAAETKRNAQAFWDALKSKERVIEVLKHAGHDPIALAQEVLQRDMDERALTPEQKRLRDAESERDRLKADADQREQAAQQEAQERADNEKIEQQRHYYEQGFIKAMSATPGLPRAPETVIRMAEQARMLHDDVPLEEIAEKTKAWDHRTIKSYLDRPDITIEEANELVPAHVQELFRKQFVKQARPQSADAPTQTRTVPARRQENPGGYVSYDEWHRTKQERRRHE